MRVFIDRGDPEILHIHTTSWRDRMTGALFLSVGAVALYAAVWTFTNQPPYRVYAWIIGGIGAFMFVPGAFRAFGRSGFTLDRGRGVIHQWSCYPWATHVQFDELSRYREVVITRYWLFARMARVERDYYYRLAIRAAEPKREMLEFASALREPAVRAPAGRIAEFLGVPVVEEKGRAEGIVAGR